MAKKRGRLNKILEAGGPMAMLLDDPHHGHHVINIQISGEDPYPEPPEATTGNRCRGCNKPLEVLQAENWLPPCHSAGQDLTIVISYESDPNAVIYERREVEPSTDIVPVLVEDIPQVTEPEPPEEELIPDQATLEAMSPDQINQLFDRVMARQAELEAKHAKNY